MIEIHCLVNKNFFSANRADNSGAVSVAVITIAVAFVIIFVFIVVAVEVFFDIAEILVYFFDVLVKIIYIFFKIGNGLCHIVENVDYRFQKLVCICVAFKVHAFGNSFYKGYFFS